MQIYILKSKNSLKIGIKLGLYETYIILKLIELVFIFNEFHFIWMSKAQVMSLPSWGNLPALSLSRQDIGELGWITGSNKDQIWFWNFYGWCLVCKISKKKSVVLNLKLYRVSYALHNPLWSDLEEEIYVKIQKIISHSILIQWP